jgi:aldehyde dehydrogenase
MAVAVQTTVYPAPGSPDSPVSLKPRYENFIGGHWVAPVEGAYSAESEPRHGQPFCEVARSTRGGCRPRARRRARGARGVGRDLDDGPRQGPERDRDAIEANLEMLAVAESWENGKPVRETLNADLPLAIDHFRYFAGAIRAEEGGISEIDKDTSPTTSTSRSASSGRSSRSTSRC